jgi:hypothetical protein
MDTVLERLRNRGRWDVAVVLVDDNTPWPALRPLPCPVLVVLPEDGPQPPSWAQFIRLPRERYGRGHPLPRAVTRTYRAAKSGGGYGGTASGTGRSR